MYKRQAHGLAELLSLPEEEVRASLRGKRPPLQRTEAEREIAAEDLVVHFLLAGKLPEEALSDLEVGEFRPEYRPIVERWLELWRAGSSPDPQALAGELDLNSQGHLARLSLLDLRFTDEARAARDALTHFLYLPRIDRRLSTLKEEMARAEGQGDGTLLRQLEAEYQELCRRRLALLRRRS